LEPFNSGSVTGVGISATSAVADLTGSTGVLSATSVSVTVGSADLEPLGALQQISGTAMSVTAATADLEPTVPPPPVVTVSSPGLLPGVFPAPKTAIELERGYRHPWQATGAPIVPSPFISSAEPVPPIVIEAPKTFHVEPIVIPTEDEALLLLMLLGASL
jgi:hypothetical protein